MHVLKRMNDAARALKREVVVLQLALRDHVSPFCLNYLPFSPSTMLSVTSISFQISYLSSVCWTI